MIERVRNYEFAHSVTNTANWIYKYIMYASSRVDAAWDYHEALALLLLSSASYGLILKFAQVPAGLALNLYMLLYGDSFISRKSSSMNLAEDIQRFSMPGIILPNNYTPGGLEEALAGHIDRPSLLLDDEFTGVLEKMYQAQHMAGLRAFFLRMNTKRTSLYKRTSKKGKADEIEIENGHLSIGANITPAILYQFTERDMIDGFLGRFGIIAPTTAPPIMPLSDVITSYEQERNAVGSHLGNIYSACARSAEWSRKTKHRNVRIDYAGWEIINDYSNQVALMASKPDIATSQATMSGRIGDFAIRIPCLVALAEADTGELGAGVLRVKKKHVVEGLQIVNKWYGWAIEFAAGVGHDPHEGKCNQVMKFLGRQPGGIASRSNISRTLHIKSRLMNEIATDLCDRGQMAIQIGMNGNRREYWKKAPPSQDGGQSPETEGEAADR